MLTVASETQPKKALLYCSVIPDLLSLVVSIQEWLDIMHTLTTKSRNP